MGMQRSTTETRELQLGDQKLYDKVWDWELSQLSAERATEEELGVSLWRFSVLLEDLVTVRLFLFRCQDTTSEDWES
jgi:hypothetical protein